MISGPGFPAGVRFGPATARRWRIGHRAVQHELGKSAPGRLFLRRLTPGLLKAFLAPGCLIGTFQSAQIDATRFQSLLKLGPVIVEKLKIAPVKQSLRLDSTIAEAQIQRKPRSATGLEDYPQGVIP